MESESNFQFAALVKDQYLPPPLQANYLSLFDIQVKTAKELLDGTQQQKIKLIKKRIKKFFDYGEDLEQQKNIKRRLYPPFQIEEQDIKTNLEINSSIIILYGKLLKELSLKSVQEKFPKPISCQKIDDCNIIITYANQQEGILKLYQQVKNKNQEATHNLFYPSNIEWFELMPILQNNQQIMIYARFGTNKQDILRNNDIYFRKILAKARNMFEKKKIKAQERQRQLQAKFYANKLKYQKRKLIHRVFQNRSRNYKFQPFPFRKNRNFNYYMKNPDMKYQSSTQSYQSGSNQNFKDKNKFNETFFQQQPISSSPMFSSNFRTTSNQEAYFQNLNFSMIKPTTMQIQINDDYQNPFQFNHCKQPRIGINSRANFMNMERRKIEQERMEEPINFRCHRQNYRSNQKAYGSLDRNQNYSQKRNFIHQNKFYYNSMKKSSLKSQQEPKIDMRQKLIQQYRKKMNDKQLQEYNYFRTIQNQRKKMQKQKKNMSNFIELEGRE